MSVYAVSIIWREKEFFKKILLEDNIWIFFTKVEKGDLDSIKSILSKGKPFDAQVLMAFENKSP